MKSGHWIVVAASVLLAAISAYMHASGPVPAMAVAPLGLLVAVLKAMNMDPPSSTGAPTS